MNTALTLFKETLSQILPGCEIEFDAPKRPQGHWWIDVTFGKKKETIEFRPEKGFGVFQADSGYGEGPSEIYRSPERAARRAAQLFSAEKNHPFGLKDLRELYDHSQVLLAEKAGVKQPAISRFENRGEVKLSTLAGAIEALGGKLEIRARFSDADISLQLPSAK